MIQKYIRIGTVVVVSFGALFFIPNPFDKEEKVKTRNVITAAGKVGLGRIIRPFTQFGEDVAAQCLYSIEATLGKRLSLFARTPSPSHFDTFSRFRQLRRK
jgi:hypothetical protein